MKELRTEDNFANFFSKLELLNEPIANCLSLTCDNFNTSPANIYLYKTNNRNTRIRCELCSN